VSRRVSGEGEGGWGWKTQLHSGPSIDLLESRTSSRPPFSSDQYWPSHYTIISFKMLARTEYGADMVLQQQLLTACWVTGESGFYSRQAQCCLSCPRRPHRRCNKTQPRIQREAPSNVEVKNMRRYTSTSPYVTMVWCLIKHRPNFILPTARSPVHSCPFFPAISCS
jgi:hypothetical protein